MVMNVAFSSDGLLLAIATGGEKEGSVHLWNTRTRKETTVLNGHNGYVYQAVFSPDRQTLATCSSDTTVRLWNAATGEQKRSIRRSDRLVMTVAYSPDGKLLAFGDKSNVYLWDAAGVNEVRVLGDVAEGVNEIVFSPDGKLLIVGCFGDGVRVWDTSNWTLLRSLKHDGDVYAMSVTSDGGLLAVASGQSKLVGMWSLNSGQVLRRVPTDSDFPMSVGFSPDDAILAVGTRKDVSLFDVKTGQEMGRLQGHSARVTCAAFSPDGKFIASGAWDKTVHLWEVRK